MIIRYYTCVSLHHGASYNNPSTWIAVAFQGNDSKEVREKFQLKDLVP